MARRDDESILDLIAELPWWMGVIAAAVTYVVMRYAIPAISTDDPWLNILLPASKMLAPLVAFAVLAAALVSAVRSAAGKLQKRSLGITPGMDMPMCPNCGGSLVVREAKRGAHAGRAFLGCSNFPKCRYTRDRV